MSHIDAVDLPIDLSWGSTYDQFLADAWPLIRPHWNEVGTFRGVLRLNPDHDRYRLIEMRGSLHILLARRAGEVVGYLFMLSTEHPRDKAAIVMRDDIFYVRPTVRRTNLGLRMIAEAVEYARDRADILMLTEKTRRSVQRGKNGGRYLAKFGLEPLETTWGMVLRNPHAARDEA